MLIFCEDQSITTYDSFQLAQELDDQLEIDVELVISYSINGFQS